MPALSIAAALIILLVLPDCALAWGPGVHMAIGNALLDNIRGFAPHMAALLSFHRESFLYGCLSADIFIGKGVKLKPVHSHNWETGLTLLDNARDDRLRAYAYGYLVHLAADVLAHNYYVPNLMGLAPAGGRLSHVSIEMLADMYVDWDEEQARALFRMPNREADGNLLTAMDQKRFLFLVRKQVFKGSLSIFGRESFNGSLMFMKRTLPQLHNEEFLGHMLQYSLNSAADFLRNPASATARFFDPIGSENQKRACAISKGRRRKFSKPALGSIFPTAQALQELPEIPAWLMRPPRPVRLPRTFRRLFRKAA